MGLESVWNRATRGIWIFSVSVSEALTFHAGTVSHSDFGVNRDMSILLSGHRTGFDTTRC
jgi:hypothetical protein